MRKRAAIDLSPDPERCRGIDRGATVLEYAALIVLAALLLGGVYWGLAQANVEDRVRQAICEILNLQSDCESGNGNEGEQKPNVLPIYCDALIKSQAQNLSVSIAWFHFGTNYSLMWEKLANGEVWLTIVPYDYQVGANFKVGQEVHAGGDVHLSLGDTYQFQSDDEARKWMGTLRDNLNEHNPASWRFWNPFDGGEKKLPDPVIKAKTIGVNANGLVGAELPGKNIDVGGHISGSVSGDVISEYYHLWDPKRHRYWDNPSISFKVSGQVDGGFQATAKGKYGGKGGLNVGAKRKWTATVRYMYNTDGTLANIRWITTYETGYRGGVHGGFDAPKGIDGTGPDSPKVGAGGELSKEVTNFSQIGFDDPNDYTDPAKKAQAQQEQKVGHDYIHKYGGLPPVPIQNAIMGTNRGVTEDPGPDADPLTRMMYDKGKTWWWQSDNTSVSAGAETPLAKQANVPALSMSTTWLTKATQKAQYLGPPEDGHRAFVNFPACEAAKVPEKHDWRLDGY